MNIFHKVTLQSMKKSRTRTIVTVIGVILSAAMITGVATFTVSLQDYMVRSAIQKYGGWHVGFPDVDPAFAQEQMADEHIADTAVFENIGYAMLDGGKNPDKPYLFLAGFHKDTFDLLPVRLLSGRLPENSGEILVPAHVAANGGVKFSVGDTLTFPLGDRNAGRSLSQHDPYMTGEAPGTVRESFAPKAEKAYQVVGICERPGFEEFMAPGYTLITMADEGNPSGSLGLFVTLKNPWKIRDYLARNAGGHGYLLNDEVLRFMGISNDLVFSTFLYTVGGILLALIMLGSIFLIYNSFTISMNDRIRQLGILMSVGATRRQLQNSVLFEGLCIGAVGIPAGVLLGLGSIRLVIAFVAKNFRNILYESVFDQVPLTLTISAPAIAGAVVVSLITILISAYLPARKAAATPVMECIRQTNEVKVEKRAVKTSKLAFRIYGLEGMLALKNFKRNRKRYRSIVLSLTLSVVLFVASDTFANHLKQVAEQAVMNSDYDICFYTDEGDEKEVFWLFDRFTSTVSGITESSYQAVSAYSCEVKAENLSDGYRKIRGGDLTENTLDLQMDIQFVEDRVFLQFLEEQGLSADEYMGQDRKFIAVGKVKETGQEDGKSRLIDMFSEGSVEGVITAGDSGDPECPGRDVVFTFVDTIPVDTLPKLPSEQLPYVFMVVAPYQQKAGFDQFHAKTNLGLTFCSSNPSQTVAEMEAVIREAGISSDYMLYNVHKMFEQNRNIQFVVQVFSYVFAIMITLIATANVFNTISTNIRLRRRELAMLRSIGISDRDFWKMMNFECIFYGMRTLAFGLPMAGVFSWLIYRGMIIGGAEIAYLFPLKSIGISVFGVFFVVFITMMYAVDRIKKENIIEALRDDMT